MKTNRHRPTSVDRRPLLEYSAQRPCTDQHERGKRLGAANRGPQVHRRSVLHKVHQLISGRERRGPRAAETKMAKGTKTGRTMQAVKLVKKATQSPRFTVHMGPLDQNGK